MIILLKGILTDLPFRRAVTGILESNAHHGNTSHFIMVWKCDRLGLNRALLWPAGRRRVRAAPSRGRGQNSARPWLPQWGPWLLALSSPAPRSLALLRGPCSTGIRVFSLETGDWGSRLSAFPAAWKSFIPSLCRVGRTFPLHGCEEGQRRGSGSLAWFLAHCVLVRPEMTTLMFLLGL